MKKNSGFLFLLFLASAVSFLFSCDIDGGMTESISTFYKTDKAHVRRIKFSKPDGELLGKRFVVPRFGKAGVPVNLYQPEGYGSKNVPCVFNIHGGSFMEGSADLLDSQSKRLCDLTDAFVVNIDYSYADEKSIGYAKEQVFDTIMYFYANAESYCLDRFRFSVIGYSAGAYFAADSAVKLCRRGIKLFSQVLCYPYIGEISADFMDLSPHQKNQMPPALFIVCSDDPLSETSLIYKKQLSDAGTKTKTARFSDAKHGFIEVNNQEYNLISAPSSFHERSPHQQVYAREAEIKAAVWMKYLY